MTALALLVVSIVPAATDSVQVLEFTSSGCPACVQMEPVVNRLQRDGISIVKVDPNRRRDLTQQYNITAMPTFIVLVNGRVFDRHTGVIPESRLRSMILNGRKSIKPTAPRVTKPKSTKPKSTKPRLTKPRSSKPDSAATARQPDTSKTPRIQLVDFGADYCQACVSMAPVVARLAKSGLSIKQINVSDKWELTRRHKIRVLPTFVVMIDGKEAGRHSGIATESELKKLVADARRSLGNDVELADAGKTRPRFPNPMSLLGLNRSKETDRAKENSKEEPIVRAKLDQRDENGAIIHRTGPMPASVRIRVRVTGGKQINIGSGTIIESRPGRSLVLTCAHIIDQIGKNPDIEIHVFAGGNSRPKSYKGEVVAHDIKSDVGLIAVRCPGPLAVVRIASEANSPKVGQDVFSYGCGRGSIPTREKMKIVELDRYDGAANIECSTTPEGGRSGGGLFSSDNKIIGICSAADKDLNEGIYAGPAAIYAILDKLDLTHLYDAADGERVAVATAEIPNETKEPLNGVGSRPIDQVPAGLAPIAHAPATDVRAILREAGDAEITCVINPLSGADSRVVIIHQASPQFVDWLEGELEKQPQPAIRTVHSKYAGASRNPAKRKRMLARPLITSDASHSRSWPYTVRRPNRGKSESLAFEATVPGSRSPKPYRRSPGHSK
jgi:thioredoxin-like negative regulator of GroEL